MKTHICLLAFLAILVHATGAFATTIMEHTFTISSYELLVGGDTITMVENNNTTFYAEANAVGEIVGSHFLGDGDLFTGYSYTPTEDVEVTTSLTLNYSYHFYADPSVPVSEGYAEIEFGWGEQVHEDAFASTPAAAGWLYGSDSAITDIVGAAGEQIIEKTYLLEAGTEYTFETIVYSGNASALNYGMSTSVPEPASMTLLAPAVIALFWRRKKKAA